MSDTPRTDEAQFGTGRVSVGFARQLELELNAANARIKRLEEAGDRLLTVMRGEEDCVAYCEWIDLAHEADLKWREAKEAKP